MESELGPALERGVRRHREVLRAHRTVFMVALFAYGALQLAAALPLLWLCCFLAALSQPQRFADQVLLGLKVIAVLIAVLPPTAALVWALRAAGDRMLVLLVSNRRCFRNLYRHDQHRAYTELQRLIDKRQPFALYLRSFAAECQEHRELQYPRWPAPPWVPSPAAVGMFDRCLEMSNHRALDSAVIAALAARLPVFALANHSDPTPPAGMTVLLTDDADWFAVFAALAERAELIVLFGAELTGGLLREATYLFEQELDARTAFLRPGDEAARKIDDVWSRLPVVAARRPAAGS